MHWNKDLEKNFSDNKEGLILLRTSNKSETDKDLLGWKRTLQEHSNVNSLYHPLLLQQQVLFIDL